MNGHQKLLPFGTGLSDDFSKTKELDSKDQFPFEPLDQVGTKKKTLNHLYNSIPQWTNYKTSFKL